MSDRIVELLRQKQLLQEHLNWLDLEIARAAAPGDETGRSVSPAMVTAVPPPDTGTNGAPSIAAAVSSPAMNPVSASEAMRKADEIIARYKEEEALRPEDTKRGCLILTAILFSLMGLVLFFCYWFFYRAPR